MKSRKNFETEMKNEWLQRMLAPRNFILFPKDFLLVMSEAEAIALAYLINIAEACRECGKLERGWFFCTIKRIMLELDYTMSKQDRVIRQLIEKGFLLSKRIGVPPRRFFKIDAYAVYVEIDHMKAKREKNTGEKGYTE